MIKYKGQLIREPQTASDIPRLFPELADELRRNIESEERAKASRIAAIIQRGREREAEDSELYKWYVER